MIEDILRNTKKYYNYDFTIVKIEFRQDVIQGMLLKFSLKKKSIYTEFLWNTFFEKLDAFCFNKEIIKNLIIQKYDLLGAAHQKFPDDILELLYEYNAYYTEALITLIDRRLKNDGVQACVLDKYENAQYTQFAALNILEKYFFRIYDAYRLAEQKILYILSLWNKNGEYDGILRDLKEYRYILNATSPEELSSYYSSENPVEILALVSNKKSDLEKIEYIKKPYVFTGYLNNTLNNLIFYTTELRKSYGL